MSAKSYSNLYKFKYCKNLCSSNVENCTYGSFCKDTKITTQNQVGSVIITSNTINLNSSNNVKINDLTFTGNTIESENDIILMASDLDVSITNLDLKATNEIDISCNDLSLNSLNNFDINSDKIDISLNNFDISTNILDISVNTVNVTIAGQKFKFEKENPGNRIFISDNNTNNIYYIDGSSNSNACTIM